MDMQKLSGPFDHVLEPDDDTLRALRTAIQLNGLPNSADSSLFLAAAEVSVACAGKVTQKTRKLYMTAGQFVVHVGCDAVYAAEAMVSAIRSGDWLMGRPCDWMMDEYEISYHAGKMELAREVANHILSAGDDAEELGRRLEVMRAKAEAAIMDGIGSLVEQRTSQSFLSAFSAALD